MIFRELGDVFFSLGCPDHYQLSDLFGIAGSRNSNSKPILGTWRSYIDQWNWPYSANWKLHSEVVAIGLVSGYPRHASWSNSMAAKPEAR